MVDGAGCVVVVYIGEGELKGLDVWWSFSHNDGTGPGEIYCSVFYEAGGFLLDGGFAGLLDEGAGAGWLGVVYSFAACDGDGREVFEVTKYSGETALSAVYEWVPAPALDEWFYHCLMVS